MAKDDLLRFDWEAVNLPEDEAREYFAEYVDRTDATKIGAHSDYSYRVLKRNNHVEILEEIDADHGTTFNLGILENGRIKEEKNVDGEEILQSLDYSNSSS